MPLSSCLDPLLSCFPNSNNKGDQEHPPKENSKPTEQEHQKSNQSAPTTAAAPAINTAAMSSGKGKVAVILYSMYGHVAGLSEKVVEGLKEAGVEYKVFQIAETLPEEVLGKMHANKAPISSLPSITPDALTEFDGFIFGFPTRYGRAPAQVSAFFDQTGGLWAKGALVGKFGAIFTSAATQHGGLESTQLTTLPFFVHHGIIYVPHGYQSTGQQNVDNIQGGSAYGAGTVAGGQGQLQPTTDDLTTAKDQGKHFGTIVSTFVKGKSA